MFAKEPEEHALVLMPSYILCTLVLIVYPLLSYILDWFFWDSLVSYSIIGSHLALFIYELNHYVSHTEKSSLEAIPFVSAMAKHHRKHHIDPKVNFGIASQMADSYFDTKK